MKICKGCGLEFFTGRITTKICVECKRPGGKFLCRFTCLQCKKDFCEPKLAKPKFCSRSCVNAFEHANGTRKVGFDPHRTTYSYWVEKFGKEIADERDAKFRKTMSEAILSADTSLQKESARQLMIGRNKSNAGKKIEEIYGIERAKELKKARSIFSMGEKNPAFGKVYKSGGKSVKGYYKSKFFRSLLEYSFMKHLESIGLNIQNDVLYECFKIPYVFNDRNATYTIDFFVPSQKTVYEVKPSYALSLERNIAKFSAAENFFETQNLTFRVMTEKEFKKISFSEAFLDLDVIWKKETFEYFRKK